MTGLIKLAFAVASVLHLASASSNVHQKYFGKIQDILGGVICSGDLRNV